jgi:two-component SAPR family response regulator
MLETDEHVDLPFTDVILPGDNGRKLADRALQLRPNLHVLFTTGHSRNAIVHHGRLDSHLHLISKPFTFNQLATKLREQLD